MTDFEKEFRDIILSNDFERFEKEILNDCDAQLRCPLELTRAKKIWEKSSDIMKKVLFLGMKCDFDFVKTFEIPFDVARESLTEMLNLILEHGEEIEEAFEGEYKNDYS